LLLLRAPERGPTAPNTLVRQALQHVVPGSPTQGPDSNGCPFQRFQFANEGVRAVHAAVPAVPAFARINTMPLSSKLFKGDVKLEACLVSDPAHLTPGTQGPHVGKVQTALHTLDGAAIDGTERQTERYGSSTAAAVLAYKRKRNIVNRAYQSTPDNIVGKMTIASLDREMFAKEQEQPGSEVCVLEQACPCDRPQRDSRLALVSFSVGAQRNDDADLRVQIALLDSRNTLREAIAKLGALQQAITRSHLPFGSPLTAEEQKTLASATTWLNLNTSDTIRTLIHLASAVSLMRRNLTIKNSNGQVPEAKRVSARFHAAVDGNPDNGIQLGDPFFGVDGRNCRRDVITHEFFHFLGVKHGGGSLGGPTVRSAITTPQQALNSADNLAQLVAELTTPSGKTDACARANE
jgi:peptidoglycan hydrolase-like protein with peptidoglycan-binding domain